MNAKANEKVPRPYRLQVYLPEDVQLALDQYMAKEFSPSKRVVTAVVSKAVAEFLEKRGYLDQQGGGQ